MGMNLIPTYRSDDFDPDNLGWGGRHRKMITPLLISNIC